MLMAVISVYIGVSIENKTPKIFTIAKNEWFCFDSIIAYSDLLMRCCCCFACQVQKSALRLCGDWSEHISSSGKKYYYNCKTEVSQWEKPREWPKDWQDT